MYLLSKKNTQNIDLLVNIFYAYFCITVKPVSLIFNTTLFAQYKFDLFMYFLNARAMSCEGKPTCTDHGNCWEHQYSIFIEMRFTNHLSG